MSHSHAASTPKDDHDSVASSTVTHSSNTIAPIHIERPPDDADNQVLVSGEVSASQAKGFTRLSDSFLTHSQLPKRLTDLTEKHCFTIAELGFGHGLNLLATWRLWRQLRERHPALARARLHFLTIEKSPLALADLTRKLTLQAEQTPELAALIAPLLAAYPPCVAGAHRLNFFDDNFTIDIWFGEVAETLVKLVPQHSTTTVDAWFLNGFAPAYDGRLWTDEVFAQIRRVSGLQTTAISCGCTEVIRAGLVEQGFEVSEVEGAGEPPHILTAAITSDTKSSEPQLVPKSSIVIGAGVSGLLTAWSLACRGVSVTLLDKSAPLAGASGNPRALLAPKMTPIHHVDEHLHTMGYLYSNRLYRLLNKIAMQQSTTAILEPVGALDLLIKANIGIAQIADYPEEMATTLSCTQAQDTSGLHTQNLSDNLYLPQAGLVNPQALKEVILTHPLIRFQRVTVHNISEHKHHVCVQGCDSNNAVLSLTADTVVICAAFESHALDRRIFDCRKIRGQLSWFTPTAAQLARLPRVPLKYSGYCTLFTAQPNDGQLNNLIKDSPTFLLGASFVRNDTSTEIRHDEHQISRDKLVAAIPEMASVVPTDMTLWQGRAGIRTQTPDYHPIVGLLCDSQRIWVMSAMGAKGYAIAPLCAEALGDMMLGTLTPISAAMLARLSPNRTRLQTQIS